MVYKAIRDLALYGVRTGLITEADVPYVINRKGDGMCPMEQSVLEIENVEEGYRILCEKAKR